MESFVSSEGTRHCAHHTETKERRMGEGGWGVCVLSERGFETAASWAGLHDNVPVHRPSAKVAPCWVPTGDHGTLNKNRHFPKKSPRREARGFMMSPPCLENLRALSLIHFSISPLLFFCLVLSLFLSYSFLLLAHSPDFFPP